jgi:hypothetical protein
MKTTKPVLQEHTFGCGVACVAFALGYSYKRALALFQKPGDAWTRGYLCRDLTQALSLAGVEYRHFYYRAKHRRFLTKPGVIVYTQGSTRYPAGHYLVRTTNGLWMNPWSNYPRIAPVKGALQKRLPGTIGYILVPYHCQ